MKPAFEKPVVVISGVNLTEGGPLSIFREAIVVFTKNFLDNYKLVLLVKNKKLITDFITGEVEIIEYRYPKKSWFLRVWFEYLHCYFISKKIKPFCWVALHDMTPNVICKNRVVYCHNPAPFYKLSLHEALIEKSLFFFNCFYSFFYRINIRKNKFVIVQQQWMREEFKKRYKIENIVVSYPDVQMPRSLTVKKELEKFQFFYPAFPRVFKNFEVLLNAVEILQKSNLEFEVVLTIDGSENPYSSFLVKKYKQLSCIKFIGLQKKEEIWNLYNQSSCLIFPSKMETWGLPVTEMKLFDKPILLADCRYSYETIGNYNKVCFFDPDSPSALAKLMMDAVDGSLRFDDAAAQTPLPPFSQSWKELFSLILFPNPKTNN